MRLSKGLVIFLALAACAITIAAVRPVNAGGGSAPLSVNPCSTTNYDDIAAKALGITAADLRVALVSGKTLQDLANRQNVPLDSVVGVLTAAFRADSDQAVADGLYDQHAVLAPPAANQPRFTPAPYYTPGRLPVPPFYGLNLHNSVIPLVVAAQALDMKCVDMVKLMWQGKSIALIAYEKNIKTQVLIDALMTAYLNATAADVKEGLIGQAEADGQNARLIERVLQLLAQPGPTVLPQFSLPHLPLAPPLPGPTRPLPVPRVTAPPMPTAAATMVIVNDTASAATAVATASQ